MFLFFFPGVGVVDEEVVEGKGACGLFRCDEVGASSRLNAQGPRTFSCARPLVCVALARGEKSWGAFPGDRFRSTHMCVDMDGLFSVRCW